METLDYNTIPTPRTCIADFCIVPIGTGNVSIVSEVTEVQRVLRDSGLKYSLHATGTTVEGSWNEVMAVIGRAHAVLHKRDVVRVQSSIRVGTRIDKLKTMEEQVQSVEELLEMEPDFLAGGPPV